MPVPLAFPRSFTGTLADVWARVTIDAAARSRAEIRVLAPLLVTRLGLGSLVPQSSPFRAGLPLGVIPHSIGPQLSTITDSTDLSGIYRLSAVGSGPSYPCPTSCETTQR